MSNVIHLLTKGRIGAADDWEPAQGECVACFVSRMVRRCACTGTLVWAEHWKRVRSPGASALIGRLEREGGICDCALVSVLWAPSPDRWQWTGSGELAAPDAVPACAGVRPRATRPCGLWSAAPPIHE